MIGEDMLGPRIIRSRVLSNVHVSIGSILNGSILTRSFGSMPFLPLT
jgi:hypothetical protein